MRKLYQTLYKGILALFTLTLFCITFQVRSNEIAIAVNDKNTASVLENTLRFDGMVFQQQKTVTGTVTDEQGIPLAGTNIIEKGTTNGVQTDFDGNFSLQLSGQNPVLVFSYLNFVTQEITVGETSTFNIVMLPDTESLEEVVVTALGIEKSRKALGYSVQEVSAEGVTRAANGNILSSLQGKVAGLNITTSGGVGGNGRLDIRGASSLSGNDRALWVIDGVPFSQGDRSDPTDLFGGISNGGALLDINPDDIESISVLKGGQAAALYGSRGANGVILITTKSGKKSKGLGISYTGSTTFSEASYFLDLQNEYGQGSQGVYDPRSRVSWGPRFDGAERQTWTGEVLPYVAGSDLIKDFTRTAYNVRHALSFTKGDDKGNIRVSIASDKNEGVYQNNLIEKLNFDLKTDYNINPWLNLDAKISYIRNQGQQRPEIGFFSFITQLNSMPANIRTQDLAPGFILRNNRHIEFLFGPNLDDLTANPNPRNRNPYFVQQQSVNSDERNRMFGYLAGNIKLAKNLDLRIKYGLDFYRYQLVSGFRFSDNTNPDGRPNYNTSERFFKEENSEFLLKYQTDITEDISFGLSAGGNIMKNSSNTLASLSGQLTSENEFFLNGGTDKMTEENFLSREIQSLYSFLDISFKNYLFLTATARNDWSSALASPTSNQISYFYPSVGLSALISEMVEMPNWINYLKLRGGWAQLGKDTEPFQTTPVIVLDELNFGLLGAQTPNRLVNPNLVPEISSTTEVGLELKLFNSRFNLDMTYYQENTNNQIVRINIPQATGFTERLENVGLISNKGIELIANVVPVKTSNFNLGLTFNFSTNKGVLEELITPADDDEFRRIFNSNSIPEEVRATEGEKLGDIFGFAYERDANGGIIVDGDGLPVRTQEVVKLGNIQADFIGSVGIDVNYKGFSLSSLFGMQQGGDIYSLTEAVATENGTSEKTLSFGREPFFSAGNLADGSPNVQIVSPQEYWGRVSGITEEFIYDASFIKLSELSIGYSFPSSLFKKLGKDITNVKLSLIGRNLFYLYRNTPGTVPDAGVYNTTYGAQAFDFSPIPVTRSLGFALNLNF